MAGVFADLSSLARLLCTCAITHEKHTWTKPSGTAFIQTTMIIRHLRVTIENSIQVLLGFGTSRRF